VIRLSLDLDRRSHMRFSVRIAAIRRAAVSAAQVQGLERAPDDPAAVICIETVEAGPRAGDLGFWRRLTGSGTPLPFPSPSRCCPGFFCERREGSSANEAPGWVGKSASREMPV
jgi:hypothetical protein